MLFICCIYVTVAGRHLFLDCPQERSHGSLFRFKFVCGIVRFLMFGFGCLRCIESITNNLAVSGKVKVKLFESQTFGKQLK